MNNPEHNSNLTEPICIVNQQWANETIPTVSIINNTFNHEKFIRDAIDGFLMQQTNFKVEILIHDDASNDNTQSIVREYEDKYPSLIFPIYQSINQYSKGIKPSRNYQFPRSRGKYIALCEGDDYWTDPLKLQKQVDCLENHPDFSICHHNMIVKYENNPENDRLWNSPEQSEITSIHDLAKGNYISTASCLFRNNTSTTSQDWFKNAPVGDYFLHMENAKYGNIRYMHDIMGVYRVHDGGIWEKTDQKYKLEKLIDIYDLMKTHYSPEINGILMDTQNKLCLKLMGLSIDNQIKCKSLSLKMIENNPEYILETHKKNLQLTEEVNTLRSTIYFSIRLKLSQSLLRLFKFFKSN
jgi:glycosyltransferase involved in cell wall biosynthesis